jgi:thiol-disulfide isomerase/thioredoxin
MSNTSPEASSVVHRRFNPVLLIFVIFPLIGLAAALGIALSSAPNGDPALNTTPGAPGVARMSYLAPNFQLTLLDGTPVQLNDYRGRVVFLNFWATWCEPCRRELPALAQFSAEQDPNTGAVVLALNSAESAETITTYLSENNITGLEVIVDPADVGRSLFGVINLPWTFVIDGDGLVRYRKIGEITLSEMYEYVSELEQG